MDDELPDALASICAETMREVERRRAGTPIETLRQRINAQNDKPRGFGIALKEAVARGESGLIAEIKRASPSAGLIRPDFDPAGLAIAYAAGGATCLSVLTEGPHFQGAAEHLQLARAAVKLPVLRKDFILDPWQVYESRAMGADCILLIMAALTDAQALELEGLARNLDLDVLAEVHDQRELERALGLQTPLIGINNRNLKTLKTNLQTTVELAPHAPPDRILVTESGIATHGDVQLMTGLGIHCFLVGESLLRQPDVRLAAMTLLGRDEPV
ncbi:MAG TPA: indole-3-glycerol phosphate synthase TrpC [Acetobacteraceae bacterium]|nr:indole-3-glycerol phosphate synthase TrpC [Acetobacteraceae bacterium]